MTEFLFKTGDIVEYDSHGADTQLNERTGTIAVVLRSLEGFEYDRDEVGNMYKVSFVRDGFSIDVFEDEISLHQIACPVFEADSAKLLANYETTRCKEDTLPAEAKYALDHRIADGGTWGPCSTYLVKDGCDYAVDAEYEFDKEYCENNLGVDMDAAYEYMLQKAHELSKESLLIDSEVKIVVNKVGVTSNSLVIRIPCNVSDHIFKNIMDFLSYERVFKFELDD